jgi:5-formyltetrahydrofolate cyclo-ligase
MTMPASKAGIREVIRRQRASLDAGWVSATSARIAERFTSLPEFKRAEVICVYLSLPGEVETRAILEVAWKQGKRVAMPAPRDDGEYMPAWLTPDEPMIRGAFGLMEPLTPHWAKPDRFDLVVVPGVAFSLTGARLGHGRGYYDRMLARLAKRVACRVGLCFSFQIVPELPVTEDDVGMDAMVTESTVTRMT